MAGLCLIIETPCAGDSGHRFLSSSPELSESEITCIATEANRVPVGATYISVSREARQLLKNSTVREGTERIILDGIEIGRLQPPDINSLKAALTSLFSPLQALAETMDWKSNERSTVIVRSELQDWIDHPKFRDVPLMTTMVNSVQSGRDAASTRERMSLARRVVWAAAIGATAMLLIATVILVGRILSRDGDPGPVPPVPPDNAAFQELAEDWGCSPEELGASLLRAANWDRREEAGIAGLDSLVVDGQVLAIIEKVCTTSPPDQFLVSPAIEHQDEFRRFVMSLGINSRNDGLALRRWLFASWQKLSSLKRDASAARYFLSGIKVEEPFSKFIVEVSQVGLDEGIGEGFRKPATPLFDRQDLMIYFALTKIHQVMRDTGVAQALIADGHVESDLSKFINTLRESRTTIVAKVWFPQGVVYGEVTENGAAPVKRALKSLEEFLMHLSEHDVGAYTSRGFE